LKIFEVEVVTKVVTFGGGGRNKTPGQFSIWRRRGKAKWNFLSAAVVFLKAWHVTRDTW